MGRLLKMPFKDIAGKSETGCHIVNTRVSKGVLSSSRTINI
jgi:hypothetical protein